MRTCTTYICVDVGHVFTLVYFKSLGYYKDSTLPTITIKHEYLRLLVNKNKQAFLFHFLKART